MVEAKAQSSFIDHFFPCCRYDGRGHLHDLSDYDAEYSTWNRDYQLSEEEARIEALCDEERYLALHTDLLEEEARQGIAPGQLPELEHISLQVKIMFF